MKKKIFSIAVIALCLAILSGSTIAYFTSEDTARNVITSGGVDIAIEEWQASPDGLVPYPEDKNIDVLPGVTVSKIVTVANLDAQSYIRVRLELVLKDAADNVMELTDAQLQSVIRLAMNGQDWTLSDGWWYYGSPLDPGDVTEPVMTAVEFDGPNMTDEYQGCTLEVNVFAQAVQTAHNGDSALEAAGWSEE